MQAFIDWVRGLSALRAENDQLATQLAVLQEAYDDLVAAAAALQREVTEATDGQVEFVPRVVCAETTLVREHNRKQFHAIVEG